MATDAIDSTSDIGIGIGIGIERNLPTVKAERGPAAKADGKVLRHYRLRGLPRLRSSRQPDGWENAMSATVELSIEQDAYSQGRIMRIVTAATAAALALAGQAAPGATSHQPTTDGIWRMDGYGTFLSIRNGAFQEYRTTAVSCLKGDSAQRTGPGTYTMSDGTVLTVRSPPAETRLIDTVRQLSAPTSGAPAFEAKRENDLSISTLTPFVFTHRPWAPPPARRHPGGGRTVMNGPVSAVAA